jgi:hypothetical protein
VTDVENSLTLHQSPNDILALQPRTPNGNHGRAMFASPALGDATAVALLLVLALRGR